MFAHMAFYHETYRKMMVKHGRVVCIGECMVEFYCAEDGSWRRGFAGDTLNVAWALRALLPEQIKVDYFTRIGSDSISMEMLEFFNGCGLGTGHVQFDQLRTVGVYTISIDKSGERSFSYWRSHSAAKKLASDLSSLEAAVKESDLIYLSGITASIINELGRKNILSCLRSAKTKGTRIVYDPNYRQNLWSSPGMMKRFTSEIVALADIALPTFEDERKAFGDVESKDTFKRLLGLGCKEIVLKNGIQQTEAISFGNMKKIDVEFVKVPKDTTGAGDSFNGAYLSARLIGEDITSSVKRAQAVSSYVVMERGALVEQEALLKAFNS